MRGQVDAVVACAVRECMCVWRGLGRTQSHSMNVGTNISMEERLRDNAMVLRVLGVCMCVCCCLCARRREGCGAVRVCLRRGTGEAAP